MDIKTSTRVEATAHLRFRSLVDSPTVTDRGVRVALSNLVLSLDEEGISLSGYGYRVRKDGEVGDQNRQVSSIDPAELPAEIVSALRDAAQAALTEAIANHR